MGQVEFLRDMDADIMDAFVDIGMADSVFFIATATKVATLCDVMIDRDVTIFGDDGAPVNTGQVVVTFQKRQVGNPVAGDRVLKGVETLELSQLMTEDESQSKWACISRGGDL